MQQRQPECMCHEHCISQKSAQASEAKDPTKAQQLRSLAEREAKTGKSFSVTASDQWEIAAGNLRHQGLSHKLQLRLGKKGRLRRQIWASLIIRIASNIMNACQAARRSLARQKAIQFLFFFFSEVRFLGYFISWS